MAIETLDDVLVVGGSVAGSTVAAHLAEQGLRVTVVERAPFPRDKVCGEGIMPAGARELQRLGVLEELVHLGGQPLRGISYHRGGQAAPGLFPDGETGLCVRRLAMDQALARRAERAGARRREGVKVDSLARDGTAWVAHAGGEQLRARFLVGADGRGSLVRRTLGLDGGHPAPARYGARQHFRLKHPVSDGMVHVYLAGGWEVYVTPSAPDCVNVACLVGKDRSKVLGGNLGDNFRNLVDSIPEVAQLLQDALPASDAEACGPLRSVARNVVADGALLVGDASGFIDAITGEGVSLALQQTALAARVAGKALASGDTGAAALQEYARGHAALVRNYRLMTEVLLWATARPRMLDRVVRAAGRRPDLFSRVLGANDGRESVAAMVRHCAWGFFWAAALP